MTIPLQSGSDVTGAFSPGGRCAVHWDRARRSASAVGENARDTGRATSGALAATIFLTTGGPMAGSRDRLLSYRKIRC